MTVISRGIRTALARRAALTLGVVVATALAGTASAQVDRDPEKVVGPGECAECHEASNKAWKHTTHHATFREMPRREEALKIARRMDLRRIKKGSACLDCHFTTKMKDGKREAVAGISCESCHGEGKDYLEIHSNFSGHEDEEDETKAEEKERWRKSEEAGMIRPKMTYRLAKNCYSCHVVPQEELVNKGKHPAGSDFELVAWSQGEVRHNVWYNDAKANPAADKNRRRKFFVVGMAVELETALRAVGNATEKANYAVSMAKRAKRARKRWAQATKLCGKIDEMVKITKIAQNAGLKLNNKAALTKAADRIGELTQTLMAEYDGAAFKGIDPALPGKSEYKGDPWQPK